MSSLVKKSVEEDDDFKVDDSLSAVRMITDPSFMSQLFAECSERLRKDLKSSSIIWPRVSDVGEGKG